MNFEEWIKTLPPMARLEPQRGWLMDAFAMGFRLGCGKPCNHDPVDTLGGGTRCARCDARLEVRRWCAMCDGTGTEKGERRCSACDGGVAEWVEVGR